MQIKKVYILFSTIFVGITETYLAKNIKISNFNFLNVFSKIEMEVNFSRISIQRLHNRNEKYVNLYIWKYIFLTE